MSYPYITVELASFTALPNDQEDRCPVEQKVIVFIKEPC